MPRYIGADALLEKLKKLREFWGFTFTADGVDEAIDEVEEAPDADVAPKSEVAREIFEEIYKSVASKIPMGIRPIFKDDRDFDGGFINGKRDALLDVLVLIAELKKKYIGEKK